MLSERQDHILRCIVERYVKTAQPVSSKELCDVYGLAVSTATVRNDMAELEDKGFIEQPHTSAGRVPTEKGYRYYINALSRPAPARDICITVNIERAARPPTLEEHLYSLALTVAELSGEAVMMVTDTSWSAVVGVANLLRKPDFQSQESMQDLAQSIEKFDRAMHRLLYTSESEVKVILGLENPFGSQLASVVIRHRLPGGHYGVTSIVGPMRMNYQKNMALLLRLKDMLEPKTLSYDHT
jgi:transcriptional regulator of heat shock response